MRVACLQTSPRLGDVAANIAAIRADARGLDVELLVLPELATTGYLFPDRDALRPHCEPIPGPTSDRLVDLATELDAVVVAGLAECDGDRLFNSAVAVGPEGVLEVYRKVHLFDAEFRLFDPGDRGFPVIERNGWRLGMMVCFDWYYPESLRSLALAGADVVAHPANLVLPWCQRSMPVRARENHVITVTANRVGTERTDGTELTFTGQSQITGTTGEILARGDVTEPGVLLADIEPRRARDRRLRSMADFRALRRPDHYRTEAPS